jgi:hypothetical protein
VIDVPDVIFVTGWTELKEQRIKIKDDGCQQVTNKVAGGLE